ncbi:asparagine--tRNA ligase [Mycoplasmopsis opalescens]|uniref:asparagine--tRNA ligase n=1 Tax=Mycoplasmopsis opalescens TaxID=114886 RepID=UPI0004A7871A|nr:asparagine--tRNA ligase [Mycoplasmopsis opalescens]
MITNSIKEILFNEESFSEQKYTIDAWLVANRGNKKIRFLEINDGSTVASLQVTCKADLLNLDEIDAFSLGSAVKVEGILKFTPEAKQRIELLAQKITLLKKTDSDYPIQKQGINVETLREAAHVRHRTSLLRSVMLIRSTLAQEIHTYFRNNGFLNFHAPIITSNDGEGAGETFVVNDSNSDKPFFDNVKATLGVTGQLHAESYALGFKKVYTFAPTFRAEHSNTKKHAAEFWMIEPEVAFADLNDIINLAFDCLKVVIKNTLEINKKEFDFLEEKLDSNLRCRLNKFINGEVTTVDYRQAIEILAKVKDRFEEKNIEFGLDFKTEHERFLAEEVFQGPVAVINFPKEFKAFYMHQNDDNQTVASFDLLVPGIGELIGGSQREARYDKLMQRVKELGMHSDELQWYLDLRRFGDAGSSGFGIGFERLIMYVTGIDNIRDTIPYPRTSGNIKY